MAIDLKSFYASVECRELGLDPMDTNLVVADESRTDKTICLAATPSLKSYGVPGRARLFEVKQRLKEVNALRRRKLKGRDFSGTSHFASELHENPALAADFLIAKPRMAHYMAYSTKIYAIYMKYVAPEDIIVYSIDEVFIDVTAYLKIYCLTAEELARRMMLDVLESTGITATAGIGTNLYLAKVAMDIMAKHSQADENGVRIAALDELSYRRELWSHRPLTDFWRVGRGYTRKLEAYGIYTMGDIARCSLQEEDLFYRLFGKNAELLIDHAWGYEPCGIADVKAYCPASKSLGEGQVLQTPYEAEKAKIVMLEMADALALQLVEQGLVTDQVVLTVGYDLDNLSDPARRAAYRGEVVTDFYGRQLPKHAHGSESLPHYSSSASELVVAFSALFDRIVNPALTVRRLALSASHVLPEREAEKRTESYAQLSLFTDCAAEEAKQAEETARRERERKLQEATLAIKKKFGKNALLKGHSLLEGATGKDRNEQIGGHRA
ncbi:DNA methylase [Stomatobaculum longum]|uniref:Y-family DNA polymerase n=1 Tax=Stomatobaculum longum TaxID=796942 RepID=UPI0028040806|nr:DNA methylase [Stomatobaculum longum]